MVHVAQRVKHQVLDSEIEALLVEAELIRLHQPNYNVLLKDDKSPIYIEITNEKYPQVKTIRKREAKLSTLNFKLSTVVGPFPSSYKLKQVLKLIRPIFKWCNTPANKVSFRKPRPCFYHHLGLCSGACFRNISPQEYQQDISHLKLFLKGKTKDVVANLKNELQQQSENQLYELAAKTRDKIQLIKEVTSPSNKLSPDFSLPNLTGYKKEKILFLQKILNDYTSLPKNYPLHRIEGYDVSNIQGTNPAVSMVTFIDGEPDKSEYKVFNIKSLNTPNDFAMMKEATTRRQNHPEWGRPNLVVIDGGKGQLRSVLSTWHWQNPVISIAKHPDRIVIPIMEFGKPVPTGLQYHIIKLPPDNPALNLIQQVRDESHRFSKKQHTRLRTKKMFN